MSKEIEVEPAAAELKPKKEKSKKRKTETEETPDKPKKEKSKKRKTEEVEEREPVVEKKSKKEKKSKTQEDSEVAPEKKSKKEKKSKDAEQAAEVEEPLVKETKSKKSKKSKSTAEDEVEVAETESEPKPKKDKSKKRKLDDLTEGADFVKLEAAPAEETAPKIKKAKKSKTADSEENKDEEMTDAPPTPKAAKKNKSGAQKKKEKKAKRELQAEGGVTTVEAVEARVAADAEAEVKEEAGEATPKVSKKGARFIVFVGNLPYTATQELLQAHFQKIEPLSIRMLTDKETGKSRGTAFVELKDWDRMNTALKLYHHSQFDDGSGKKARRINVELSAGGGGKSANRTEKIKLKNDKLYDERRQENQAKKLKDGEGDGKEGKKAVENAAEAEDKFAGIHPSRRRQMGA